MRIAVAAAAIYLSIVNISMAQDAQALIRKPTHIPAQGLGLALKALAADRGLQVIYLSDGVDSVRSQGASGELTSEEALKELLSGTGLSYRYLDDKTVTIFPAGSTAAGMAKSAAAVQDYAINPIHLAQSDASSVENAAGGAGAEARAPGKAAAGAQGLEEVVVTATKRKESLQKLPQAVTAITSRRLDELNAMSFQDYFRDVPGLMMNTDSLGHLDFTIRGISDFNLSIPQYTATVGQYFDEIPVTAANVQLDMRLVDVERIEVLRGPQGTYYGDGSLGGTIRTITKKPDLERFSASTEGRVSATEHGGTNHQESLMLNVPLLEGKLALRGNYFNAADSGYIDVVNVADRAGTQILGLFNDDANTNRAKGGRVMALFVPTETLSFLAEALRTNTYSGRLGGYDPGFADLAATVTCPTPPLTPPAPGQPLLPSRPNCYDTQSVQSVDLYNLTVNADFGWASLVSASSWGSTDRNQSYFPGAPNEAIPVGDVTTTDAFAQELRLVSSTNWSEHWDYAVGVFGNRSKLHDVGLATAGAVGLPISDRSTELAFFGEVGYRFASHWSLRAGVRESNLDLKKQVATPAPDAPPGGPLVTTETRDEYQPVTGRVVLNYAFNENALMYGSVANGFRRGGFNLPSPFSAVTFPESYDPDYTTNYEVGWKLTFPSARATLNGAVFHIDWKDTQSEGLAQSPGFPPVTYRRNSGNSVVDGFELEGGLELLKGLSLRGSFAYLDARLAEDYAESTTPLVLHGRKGDKLPFVAPVSGSVSLNYRRSLRASGLSGFAIFNAQYQGERHSDFNPEFDNPNFRTYAEMKPYWTTGAQIGVENASWRAALYADNLWDDRAQLFMSPTALPGHYTQVTTRPRTVGVFLRWNWD